MANKLFEQVGGTIRVKLGGKNQEKVINMASARGIYIWDIKRNGPDLNLKVRSSAFKALQTIAEENGFALDVTEKKGLPFYGNIIRKRMGFLGGALLFIMALYLLSSFVWFIDVTGNKKVDSKKIILTAARHGVYQGAAKWNFRRTEVEQHILQDISELTYVKLDIKGVRVQIQVVEKILPLQDGRPCHIVASKEGVIDDILVLEGEARVKPGDVVSKGDILISGVVVPQKSPYVPEEEQEVPEPYIVQARGEVKARVWHDGYGECQLRTEKLLVGHRKKSYYNIITPYGSIALSGAETKPFAHFIKKTSRKTFWTIWGECGVNKVQYQETIPQVREYTEEQALKIARQKAVNNAREKLEPNAPVINMRIKILSSPSEDIIRVKASLECYENIVEKQPINMVP
ncbi:sporulation protein YqfD [Syntrophomonas palmitatica]|uniref:sporulation protein YqfD n=1 Tax=Syntrophomonas palmitatica TaxID=402877 RepID=UPI0006D03AA2|nr:sporulation protein YqfD [Syntrophomonas palmitatica]